MRVSELAGINLQDIRGDTLRVVGKGNKERTIYLNDACMNAIEAYLSLNALCLIPQTKMRSLPAATATA